MWMKGTMITKMNEMEVNHQMNELDFGTWNQLMKFGKWNEWDKND